MNPTATLLTADQLERLPRDGMRHELVRGELRTMPPSGGEHGFVEIKLASPMYQHATASHLGAVVTGEVGFVLATDPDTVRGADIAFIRAERIPPGGIPRSYWRIAPDLAVEIVSPNDTLIEVEEKVQEWLAAGTVQVWVVNPRRRTVTVHRSATDVTVLTADCLLEGGDLLPGFRLRVGDIFG